MRVLVVEAGRGGATVTELLARLVERGHAVRLIDADFALIRQSAEFRPDVVLVVSGDASVKARRAVRKASRVCGRPVVSLIPHGLLSYGLGPKAKEFEPDDWCIVANDSERRALIDRLRLPAEHVVTCGALEYDPWFEPAPSLGRTALCTLLGLNDQRPFMVCRASPASKYEPMDRVAYRAQRTTIAAWVQSLASETPPPFDVLLMSPYGMLKPWQILVERTLTEVAEGTAIEVELCEADPADPLLTRDAIFHSSGFFAVDPTSFVEAVIVERPAYLLRPDQPHMPTAIGEYLASESGSDPSIGSHGDGALLSPESRQRFLEEHIRPDGVSTPAWDGVVRALEHIASVTA